MAVRDFTQIAPQSPEPDTSLELNRVAILGEFPAVAASVRQVREAAADLAAQHGAPSHRIDDVRLAVSEAASNVVMHAYGDGEPGALRVLGVVGSGDFLVIIEDNGCGLSRPSRSPGLGAGLRVMEQVADEALFMEREQGGSAVQLRFSLSA